MIVIKENERLYATSWQYNSARILTRLAQLITAQGGKVKPLYPAVISALARTRILADTATAYHDENDSLLLSSYVDYLNSHFEAFACTSDTETLKLLALTNKAISNILYRALQIADEDPTQLSL